ncbi:MAG: hypothetical protein ACRDN9_04560 [Streptosporangiaceae bacterium]
MSLVVAIARAKSAYAHLERIRVFLGSPLGADERRQRLLPDDHHRECQPGERDEGRYEVSLGGRADRGQLTGIRLVQRPVRTRSAATSRSTSW